MRGKGCREGGREGGRVRKEGEEREREERRGGMQ